MLTKVKYFIIFIMIFTVMFQSCNETSSPNKLKTEESGYFRSVYFLNADTGWVVGKFGLILKTTDGGVNWNPQSSETSNYLRSIYFIDNKVAWAAGWFGTILKTTNGGLKWDHQIEFCLHTLRV